MLQIFMNSVYVSGEGGPLTGRYTSNQLLALFFAGLVGPISALGVFDSLDQIVKGSLVQPAVKKVSTAFVFFASLAYFCVGYYQWEARDLLRCGFIYCTDKKEPSSDGSRGALITTGLVYCVTSLVLMAKSVQLSLVLFYRSESPPSSGSLSGGLVEEPLIRSYPSVPQTLAALQRAKFLMSALVLYLFFFFATTILPGAFSDFDDVSIASFIRTRITSAEGDGAWLKTFDVPLGSIFFAHIFPDTIIYYSTLISIALIGYFRVPCIASVPIVIFQVALFVIYWVQSHLWEGYAHDVTKSEAIARSTGQIAVYIMSLLILPVSRTSPFHALLNVSWESVVQYHIYLGYLFLLLVSLHLVSWGILFVNLGFGLHDLYSLKWYYPNDGADKSQGPQSDNFTEPLVALNTYLLFISMGVLSLWKIRRRFYEVFYHAHMITFTSLTVAVFWHASSAWYYLAPSLTLYIYDRWARASNTKVGIGSATVFKMSNSTVTRLRIEISDNDAHVRSCPIKYLKQGSKFTASPGQYVLLQVPSISAIEWHPFTLSNISPLEIHVKANGAGSFSCALANLPFEGVDVAITGPYGLGVRAPESSRALVLVGGGIGITPCVSVLRGLLQNNTQGFNLIKLIWVVRESDTLAIFDDFLASTTDHRPFVEVELYSTRPLEDSNLTCNWPVNKGRPNLQERINTMIDDTHVFACGPGPLVESARSAAKSMCHTFHTETFEL